MFGHTVGGHDIASSLTSVGNGLPMQKLKESPLFRNHAKVFTKKSKSQEKEEEKQQQKTTTQQQQQQQPMIKKIAEAGGRGSCSVVWRNCFTDDSA